MNLRKDHYRFTNQVCKTLRDKAVSGPSRPSLCKTFCWRLFEGRGTWPWMSGLTPGESKRRAACCARRPARFKEPAAAPTLVTRFLFTVCISYVSGLSSRRLRLGRLPRALGKNFEIKTLSGGSLGSRVDEERSQLRELM